MPHTLLLADDSVTIQRVIELTFSGQDVEVLVVGDGEQAIARIQSDRPDIVLADIGMPKRNGYDVAAFVKNDPDLRHIPVLLLAGAFEPVDEARAAEVRCDGVLVKPFEPQQVIARVRELLGGAAGTPTQAIPDMLRAVAKLAPRTLEFPQREEAPPIEEPFFQAQPQPEELSDPLPEPLPEPQVLAPTFERDAVERFRPDEPPSAAYYEPPPVHEEPPRAPELAANFVPPPERGPDESLEDYFSRLDAAFSSLTPAPPAVDTRPEEPAFDDRLDLPTLDALLRTEFSTSPAPPIDVPLNAPPVASPVPMPPVAPPPIEPQESPATFAPAASSEWSLPPQPQWNLPPDPPASAEGSVVADAFKALLAVEQGEPGAAPVRLTSGPSGLSEPVITEAFLDEVVRRVLDRLGPDVARTLVAGIVSEVSERLVTEEIERIRKKM